jgi:hypothetical protein
MERQSNGGLGIAILAHNEAGRIARLVDSLFKQSIFHREAQGRPIKVACIPNGCTDDTAAVAKRVLGEAVTRLDNPDVTWVVDELGTAGKANAWNHCVHATLAGCEYLCFLDADIVFATDDTIASALAILAGDARVCVATDRPIKGDPARPVGWRAAVSRFFSQSAPAGPTEICGQFYCARASVLDSIWLPAGLPVEDGFLRAMIITNEFRQPEDPHRIARAERGSHFFEAKTRPGDLWRHKKRLMIGTTLNSLLFRHLWAHAGEDGAGRLLREELEKDPAWLVPMGHVLRRLAELRSASFSQAARRAPVALAATTLDMLAAVSANREIKRNLGLGFW